MNRRAVLIGLAGVGAWPLIAGAQGKPPVIGFLIAGNAAPTDLLAQFRAEMRNLGYVDGQNLRIEFRAGDATPASLVRLAEDLVGLNVNVIVTWQTPAVRAAKQATSRIPIVMAGAGDPVATGIVASLTHPGGNITGTASVTPELAGKNIELIRELLPAAKKLAALCNETDSFTKVFLEQVRAAATKERFELDAVMTNSDGVEAAFRRIRDGGAEAVMVQPSLPVELCARLALEAHLPAVCPQGAFAKLGGLFGYSGVFAENFQRAAEYVDKILKGAKPDDLPIQLPTMFDLAINLKTARALGLTIPPAVLARAGTVIE
jgi:putative ABC transport system substrate-binding protein